MFSGSSPSGAKGLRDRCQSGLACATGSQCPRPRPPPSRTLIAPPLAFACLPAANELVWRLFTDASLLLQLKERNGSSRQALKKYVKANNQINVVSDTMFDSLFNKALRAGVEKGVFEQPKGMSTCLSHLTTPYTNLRRSLGRHQACQEGSQEGGEEGCPQEGRREEGGQGAQGEEGRRSQEGC